MLWPGRGTDLTRPGVGARQPMEDGGVVRVVCRVRGARGLYLGDPVAFVAAVEGTAVKAFFSDLKDIMGPGALAQVLLKIRENDLLGLAGQLTYFFLLSFFPFLIFVVALAGLVLNHPESAIRGLIGKSGGFLPQEAVQLLVAYLDRTLRGAGPGVLLVGIVTTLWMLQEL